MSPISASDPKTLIAYQRGLKWPSMEPPDKDEFLSDIMEILDDEDDTIGATLLYLGRKHMPPERLIESIRDLYRTRFSSCKEKLISHHTDSLKNKAHISEIIAFIDDYPVHPCFKNFR